LVIDTLADTIPFGISLLMLLAVNNFTELVVFSFDGIFLFHFALRAKGFRLVAEQLNVVALLLVWSRF